MQSPHELDQLVHKLQPADRRVIAARCLRRVIPLFRAADAEVARRVRRLLTDAAQMVSVNERSSEYSGMSPAAHISHIFQYRASVKFWVAALAADASTSGEQNADAIDGISSLYVLHCAAASLSEVQEGIGYRWVPRTSLEQGQESGYFDAVKEFSTFGNESDEFEFAVAAAIAASLRAARVQLQSEYSEITAAAPRKLELALLGDLQTISTWPKADRDSTALIQRTLGPLWPSGVPEGWPVSDDSEASSAESQAVGAHANSASSATQRLTIRLAVPSMEDTPQNREQLRQHIKELVKQASKVHIAHGGSGLKIDKLRAHVPVGLPEGSPS